MNVATRKLKVHLCYVFIAHIIFLWGWYRPLGRVVGVSMGWCARPLQGGVRY